MAENRPNLTALVHFITVKMAKTLKFKSLLNTETKRRAKVAYVQKQLYIVTFINDHP